MKNLTSSKTPSIHDKFAQTLINQYLAGKQSPWSDGYILYRREFISQTLADSDLMTKFRKRQRLPAGYGASLDERCVEYPWLISRIGDHAERILDAGGILNHAHILDHPVWQQKKLHILSLAPEQYCYWDRHISYLFEDLREIPTRDNFYDTVVCLSTLEHIGLGEKKPFREEDYILASEEMRRVLKPKGRLFLSVPYGRSALLSYQRVFNQDSLEKALAAFSPKDMVQTFFRYTQNGWQLADSADCRESEYVDWEGHLAGRRTRPFPQQSDGAAAARAVACIRLTKQG